MLIQNMSAFHYPEDIANLRKNTELTKRQTSAHRHPSHHIPLLSCVQITFAHPNPLQSCISCTNILQVWPKQVFSVRFGQQIRSRSRFRCTNEICTKQGLPLASTMYASAVYTIMPSKPYSLYTPPAKPSFSPCFREERAEKTSQKSISLYIAAACKHGIFK